MSDPSPPRPALGLRPVHLDDAAAMVAAIDRDSSRNLSFFDEALSLERQRDYLGRMIASEHDALFGLELGPGGRLVGTVGLHELDRYNRTARLGLLVFQPADRGHGYGTAAVGLALGHGFGELGLNKVYLNVFASNHRGQSLYARLGFVAEGRLRSEYLLRGEPNDLIRMAILHDEWQGAV